ncbi:stomatin-like protein [Leptospira interrogans serovar Linhai str. 56609]|uniref:slipin family protein n=1 Tax=Leptospira interrogans TaxID=173 RepID=UPI0002BE2496|nr:slipin family protein [Leptospira interrogans]AJR14607.1 stomatin-like protein [Leptospira interrogans serovar Linhai str. 56609]EMN68107.1 SPFH domain/Band 7 family protein [Leptospira interrogans serovar Grippotyphosa str. UI 08434]
MKGAPTPLLEGMKMKIVVNPNEKALLYVNSKLEKVYDPGVYRISGFLKKILVFKHPTIEFLITVTNQELLTKDNVALRLSFSYNYKIVDSIRFSENFSMSDHPTFVLGGLVQQLTNLLKVEIRERISNFTIFELNEKREKLFEGISEKLNVSLAKQGVILTSTSPLDFSFPKNVQEIFAKLVESKVRALADLENARTQVAMARTLKNAAELMKGDENLKFFQFLETISRIASKGSHSFVIGTDSLKKN